MKPFSCRRWTMLATVGAAVSLVSMGAAISKAQDRTITLGDSGLFLVAPESWERKQPTSRIVEHEFSIPPVKGDELAGRLTVMGAGGSVDANIERWIGQFSQPDGSDSKKAAKVDKRTVGGQEVHIVDLSGTYKDSPAGPFSGKPPIDRPSYRMLAAIVVSKAGNYFLKFYGPQQTVTEHEKAFLAMVDGLTKK